MSDHREAWKQLLRLEPPWQIEKLKINQTDLRCDIWVSATPPRKWFSFTSRSDEEHYSWRHVNFGQWQTHLHATVTGKQSLNDLAWAGETDIPFSHELAGQIVTLFKASLSLRDIAQILKIPANELWTFRYAIDSGRLKVATLTPLAEQPEEETGSGVPPLSNPVWGRLADGQINLEVRALALKMMLSKTQAQMKNISDSEVRDLKLNELQRYFVKNRNALGHELAQLTEEAKNV